MSVADRVRIASLELQLGRYESDKHDSKVIALKFEADVLEKKIDRAIRLAKLRSSMANAFRFLRL